MGRSARRVHRPPAARAPHPTATTGEPRVPAAEWRFLAACFALAWGWRFLYLRRLAATPLADVLNADADIYWSWASLMRQGLAGAHAYFLGPLYPHVLAALRALVGDRLPAVLQIQAVGGAAAVALLADAARRATSTAGGIVVAVALVGYEMAVFFDGLILSESLLFLLEALLVWIVARTRWEAARAWVFAALGLLVGLIAQGRGTSILLALPVAALAAVGGAPRATVARRVGVLAAALALTCAPAALHNLRASGEWIPFTYNFGYNLRVGFNRDATGSFVPITGTFDPYEQDERASDGGAGADGRAYLRAVEKLDLSPAASSRHWAGEAGAFIRREPLRAARLVARKLAMAWNHREYMQIDNADAFRRLAGPMGIPWVGQFGFLAVLGAAGLARAWRRNAGRFAIACVTLVTIALLPFFVTDRYRLHLVPGLSLLAAFGVEALREAWGRGPRAWRAPLAGAALAAGVIALPLPGYDRARGAWNEWITIGDAWLEHRRPDQAAVAYRKAIDLDERGELGSLARTAVARHGRADAYHDYALALEALGRLDEAARALDEAAALLPDSRLIVEAQARVEAMRGRGDRARECLARLGTTPQQAARDMVVGAFEADRAGDKARTRALLEGAVAIDPTCEPAWVALVRWHLTQGRPDDAARTLAAARAAGLREPAGTVLAAVIAAARGDLAEAARLEARVPKDAASRDPSLAPLVEYLRQVLAAGSR